MSDAPRYPAGWYPDPANPAVLRWWDGLRWTEATQQAYLPPQPPEHRMPQPAAVTASEPAPAAEPEPAPAPEPSTHEPASVVAPEPPAYVAPAAPAAAPVAPPLPPAPQYAYLAAPTAVDVAQRRDIPTGTVWIWLVVLLPLVSLSTIFLLDWRGLIDEVMRESMSSGAGTQSLALGWSVGSIAISLLGYVVVAAQVVFAYLDWRALRARGVDRPFHWAWIFFALAISNGVYVIGRGVVLRRRTGTGLGPVWAWIAVTALSWIISIVFALVLLNEVFAIIERAGYMS